MNDIVKRSEESKLTLLQGMVLDLTAEGKSARQISEIVGLPPSEVHKMAYDLLDREIITDVDQRRKLQVYRLEKIIEALWQRVMNSADRDDVKNLVDTLEKLNTLLGLNKEADEKLATRIHEHQIQVYLSSLMGLIAALKAIAPNLMTETEWQNFAAERLEIADKEFRSGN